MGAFRGEVKHIEVRGPADSLLEFVSAFLSDDTEPPGAVYILIYL
jgi:hypothetical protein